MPLESHKNHTCVTSYGNRRGRWEVLNEQNRLVRQESQSQESRGKNRGHCILFLWKLTLGLGKKSPVNNKSVWTNAVCRTNIPLSGWLSQRDYQRSSRKESSLCLNPRIIKKKRGHPVVVVTSYCSTTALKKIPVKCGHLGVSMAGEPVYRKTEPFKRYLSKLISWLTASLCASMPWEYRFHDSSQKFKRLGCSLNWTATNLVIIVQVLKVSLSSLEQH